MLFCDCSLVSASIVYGTSQVHIMLRNINKRIKAYLIGTRYEEEKKLHGGDRKSSGNSYHLKTSEQLAEQANIGSATVRRNAIFSKALNSLI